MNLTTLRTLKDWIGSRKPSISPTKAWSCTVIVENSVAVCCGRQATTFFKDLAVRGGGLFLPFNKDASMSHLFEAIVFCEMGLFDEYLEGDGKGKLGGLAASLATH